MWRLSASAFLLAILLGAAPCKAEACQGLAAHERAHGHTLERHVGKDAAFLSKRIQDEHVSAASTFRTAQDAERLVSAGLAANRDKIAAWRGGRPARLVFSWRAGEVTGLSLSRRRREPREVHGVRFVLQRDRRMDCGYHLVTAYPEAP